MPKPTFAERLEALAALREPIRRRLYQYIERRALGAGEGRDQDPLPDIAAIEGRSPGRTSGI
jgi:hypothetical protein